MTDTKRTLTRPYVQMFIIVAVLILVGVVAFTQIELLRDFFLFQAAINTAILVVAALSAGLIIYEVLGLSRTISWVKDLPIGTTDSMGEARADEADAAPIGIPHLLIPLQSLITNRTIPRAQSPENLSMAMEAIKARNDDRRDIIQYLLQLLIFLGLFGTFWGLTLTIGEIGKAFELLSSNAQAAPADGDGSSLLDRMIENLQSPVASMGVAFSSSLFGLAGTIIVGFLEQQSSQAHSRFIDELENLLFAHTQRTGSRSYGGGEAVFNMASAGDFLPASNGMDPEVLATTNAKLEQIDAGLSRNHDQLVAALQSLVSIQDEQKSTRKEEHGKLASLAMLTDTNERMSAIMESWNHRSDQYFQEANRSSAQMVKLTEDIERLIKSRDSTRTLNDRLGELNRELGDNARRTESAFLGLRDFLSSNETGDQLKALLVSMESNRAELQALRFEAAERDKTDG